MTPNDAGDADTGANNLQNAPEIASSVTEAERTTVTGSLNSGPNTSFTLEFFANTDCNDSGFGEGETLLGSIIIVTDDQGDADFEFIPAAAQNPGSSITVTATDPNGNTSEFSACAVTE